MGDIRELCGSITCSNLCWTIQGATLYVIAALVEVEEKPLIDVVMTSEIASSVILYVDAKILWCNYMSKLMAKKKKTQSLSQNSQ